MTRDLERGAKIYLKREDLNHTGAHKINNVLGQVLLAKKMGKTRVIAETGAGQVGVATALPRPLMDMECEVFMGAEDIQRQALNVFRMELLGAKSPRGNKRHTDAKDAVNETMREWVSRMDDTHYVLGSVMGPHPFPANRAGLSKGHRRGDKKPGLRGRGQATGCGCRLCRRRKQCHRSFL